MENELNPDRLVDRHVDFLFPFFQSKSILVLLLFSQLALLFPIQPHQLVGVDSIAGPQGVYITPGVCLKGQHLPS